MLIILLRTTKTCSSKLENKARSYKDSSGEQDSFLVQCFDTNNLLNTSLIDSWTNLLMKVHGIDFMYIKFQSSNVISIFLHPFNNIY